MFLFIFLYSLETRENQGVDKLTLRINGECITNYHIGVSFDGRNFRGFRGFKHNRENFAAKQRYLATRLLQMYKLLSTGMRRFYHEYTWKASTTKVLPSETYPLYGMLHV